MKPHRIVMAHNLIVHYNLHRKMEITGPFPAEASDIQKFNSLDYTNFLASVTPEVVDDQTHSEIVKRYNVGRDCPIFDRLFSFCQGSAGGSIGAAVPALSRDRNLFVICNTFLLLLPN